MAETTEQAATREAAADTATANRAATEHLPFEDSTDFDDAVRGLIAEPDDGPITGDDGRIVWDMGGYGFEAAEEAPASVHPSLWRQARLNRIAGLFEVTDRVYQLRGFDLSNMSIIEGDSGIIVIDPLISTECAAAGLELYRRHRGDRPVHALIYTHSHTDHYGGVKGVIDQKDVDEGRVRVIAPEGFLRHAVSENVFAGTAMSRRAHYQYGVFLARDETGHVDLGLGKAISAGTITLIAPTDTITETGQSLVVDGVEMEFQLTPGTEAPAEMNFYFPQFRALCGAENTSHTLHNLLTLRGAEVRDAHAWSHYLDETMDRYAARTDVLFASHHWPTWGTDRVTELLADQRDMYRFLHDQTLRLINHGYTPTEISDTLVELPPGLNRRWYTHGYYGSVSHNVRAIYQRYLGFYDGNPAHLNPLPPVENASRYVEAFGGLDAALDKGRAAFEAGDYRWAAELVNHIVYAEPDSETARTLQADILEQLGFQCENGTWRDVYLSGAHDLRNGVGAAAINAASPDTVRSMTPDLWFDYLGIRLNCDKAADLPTTVFNWTFTDLGRTYVLTLRNATLTYRVGDPDPGADTTLTLSKSTLDAISLGDATFESALADDSIALGGDADRLQDLLASLDTFALMFPLVTPRERIPEQRTASE